MRLYKKKDELVVKLLDELNNKFKDDIIFTGGTSLLKRGIISRFSEDLDIICKISRKDVINYINQSSNWQVVKCDNGSFVCTYSIYSSDNDIDKIKIQLDLVKAINKFDNDIKLRYELIDVTSINKQSYCYELVNARVVEGIFIDKVCAILEYDSIVDNRQLINQNAHYDIRFFRHFYDLVSIYLYNENILHLIDSKDIDNEFIYRTKTNPEKISMKKYNFVLSFINSSDFDVIYDEFQKQIFDKQIDIVDLKAALLLIFKDKKVLKALIKIRK